jgi:hypothetical protein
MRSKALVFAVISGFVLLSTASLPAEEKIPFEIRLNVADEDGKPLVGEPFLISVTVQKTGKTLFGDSGASNAKGQFFRDATVSRENATGYVRTEVVRQLTGERIVQDANSYVVGKPPVYYTASTFRFKNQ